MQEPRREEDGENKITPNLWKREMDKAASSIWKREGVEADKLGPKREEETRGEERLNMTVTGAEPSSPSREAARAAAGWAKFHGRTSGRSVSVLLQPEEAAAVRGKRRGEESRDLHSVDKAGLEEQVGEEKLYRRLEEAKVTKGEEEEEGSPPPLPPKPRQKISVMGSPNTEHFIVMDNSALFSARQKREGEEKEKSEPRAEEKEKAALQESHSRSDSGLSSLSSWTAVSKSGCSSVRSSSIVSDCSSKIEELLEEEVGTRTFLSTCSLKLENLIEHDEIIEKQEAEAEAVEEGEEEEYDDVCQSSSAVQRQLETIRQQKSDLIRQIMVNEEVGRGLADRLEAVTTIKEQEKYSVFLTELEKVVLLVFSVSGRLRKAEEEAEQGNLTDWEKESRRFRRDKLASQLKEAQELRRMSDRRMANVEAVIKRSLEAPESELELFRSYISKKEELVTAQRACEDLEKNILN